MLRKLWFSRSKSRLGTNGRSKSRSPRVEALESRALMASDAFHNFVMPNDVDDDGSVTPLDALVVINRINHGRDDSRESSARFHDVDDDQVVSPLDALIVVNELNSSTSRNPTRFEASKLPLAGQQVRARVELETFGGETELKIRIDNAPVSKSLDVSLNDIALGQLVTDSRGRGQLVLSRGDDNRDHLPLPDAIQSLSRDMEIVIGDIIRGPIGSVTKIESQSQPSLGTPSTSSISNSQNLVAKFDSLAGVLRSAEYEQQTENGSTKRKFKAQIEHGAANTSYVVIVQGVAVGSLTTNSRGKGSLSFTSQLKNAKDLAFPANFPNVAVGTKISIGDVSSTFVASAP